MADFSTVLDHGPPQTGSAPTTSRETQLIYDWNELDRKGRILPKNATFFDETLRDGLQNPLIKDPPIGDKLAMSVIIEDSINSPASRLTPAWISRSRRSERPRRPACRRCRC